MRHEVAYTRNGKREADGPFDTKAEAERYAERLRKRPDDRVHIKVQRASKLSAPAEARQQFLDALAGLKQAAADEQSFRDRRRAAKAIAS